MLNQIKDFGKKIWAFMIKYDFIVIAVLIIGAVIDMINGTLDYGMYSLLILYLVIDFMEKLGEFLDPENIPEERNG